MAKSEAKLRHVGLIIDITWTDQNHLGIIAGVEKYAKEAGNWDLVVSPHLSDSLRIPCSQSRYDGIIARVTPRWAKVVEKARIPLVNVLQNHTAKNVPTVVPDRQASGVLAAEHFLARGFRTFGYLGFRPDKNSRLQFEGYRRRLQEEGLDCNAFWTSFKFDENYKSWERFVAEVEQWMATWERPMAILATTDHSCRHLASLCNRRGVNIPHDVALIGSHNHALLCEQTAPTLTSIDMGFDRVGFEAAKLLDSLMKGGRQSNKTITLPPTGVIVRKSTDAMAVDDPLVGAAMGFISERAHHGIKVPDVVEAVGVNRRTLERRFQIVLGRTIADEMTRHKIERIQRRLVNSDETIRTLALGSGFISAKQLVKTFSDVVGMTPREYRRQRREKGIESGEAKDPGTATDRCAEFTVDTDRS
jgi:LacI family transcriptional regulator